MNSLTHIELLVTGGKPSLDGVERGLLHHHLDHSTPPFTAPTTVHPKALLGLAVRARKSATRGPSGDLRRFQNVLPQYALSIHGDPGLASQVEQTLTVG
jgi:hypothetical protein